MLCNILYSNMCIKGKNVDFSAYSYPLLLLFRYLLPKLMWKMTCLHSFTLLYQFFRSISLLIVLNWNLIHKQICNLFFQLLIHVNPEIKSFLNQFLPIFSFFWNSFFIHFLNVDLIKFTWKNYIDNLMLIRILICPLSVKHKLEIEIFIF